MRARGLGLLCKMLREVPGIRVGHDTVRGGRTGCTVVLCPPGGAVAGVDVRGSAPGTRETDLLRPEALVERIHAVVLCGGSAFGLAAADGVMTYLSERGVGFATPAGPVPIVPAAVIYDLVAGRRREHPGARSGYRAALAAEQGAGEVEGRVGAGAGARVGKLLGRAASMPGGVGSAWLRLPSGVSVGALAVVNALGDVVDRQGAIVAGARAPGGGFADAFELLLSQASEVGESGPNTTLGVVATDARLDRAGASKLAQIAHDALALAIRPVHTRFDGDTVFALSCGELECDPLSLGAAAVSTLRDAIIRAVGG